MARHKIKNNSNVNNSNGIEILVPQYLKMYSDYVNKEKMLPYVKDGLIQSHRRFLLTLHLHARNKYIVTISALGLNCAEFHPHAPQPSTPSTLFKQGFIDGQGQLGSISIGIPDPDEKGSDGGAAAPRYTKVKAKEEIENMAFKYVNAVEWKLNELDNKEPDYIPSMFPFCLMGKMEMSAMGYGFKTDIPVYSIQDLYKRLEFLLGHRKNEPTISPIIGECEIISSKQELKSLLSSGSGIIKVKGTIEEDPKNNAVIIKSWNPGTNWGIILQRINKYNSYNLLDKDDIIYRDESTDKTGTRVVFEVNKSRNIKEVYSKMVESVENALYDNVSYNIYAISDINDEKIIGIVSVDEMLITCYNTYKDAFLAHNNNEILRLNKIIEEFNIIISIRPYIKDCIASNLDVTKSIELLSNKTGHPKEVISNILDKYKIKKLISINLDVKKINDDISKCKNNIKKHVEIIKEEYTGVI